jgi:hypothetical protein
MTHQKGRLCRTGGLSFDWKSLADKEGYQPGRRLRFVAFFDIVPIGGFVDL